MSSTPLVLKNPKGWFAAGAEVERAMEVLSDGAFKLFVYLCLNARRDTGVLATTQTELARSLKKGLVAIRGYLREMEAAGVCRSRFTHSRVGRGMVEMAEAYWPYQKGEQEMLDDAARKAVPWEERFSDPTNLEETLRDTGLRAIEVGRRSYRNTMPIADYLAGRETSAVGRFLRQILGETLWPRFQARVEEEFRARFTDPIGDSNDVLIAVGTKP